MIVAITISGFVSFFIGYAACAILSTGARADLETENMMLKEQLKDQEHEAIDMALDIIKREWV